MITIGKLQVIFDHHFNSKHQRVSKTIIFNSHGKFIASGSTTIEKGREYCKDLARRKALKAAFARAKNLSKRQRTNFWEAYRTEMTDTPRW